MFRLQRVADLSSQKGEFGGRSGGLAAAFLNTLGNGGGALAPWLTAVLMQRFNWHVSIGVACVVCSLGGILWLFLDPVHPVQWSERRTDEEIRFERS